MPRKVSRPSDGVPRTLPASVATTVMAPIVAE
jgi:hypothetical protein